VLPKHWANFLTRAYNAGKARIENISWGIEHDQAETYSADVSVALRDLLYQSLISHICSLLVPYLRPMV